MGYWLGLNVVGFCGLFFGGRVKCWVLWGWEKGFRHLGRICWLGWVFDWVGFGLDRVVVS